MRVLLATLFSVASNSAGYLETWARSIKEKAAALYLQVTYPEDIGDLVDSYMNSSEQVTDHRNVQHILDLDGHPICTFVREHNGAAKYINHTRPRNSHLH